jgi:DNA-directed RNA polymerase specialized sigma24 family protein
MPEDHSALVRSPRFKTTRWTTVLSAGTRRDTSGYEALSSLCGAYWYPLYAFVRRKGHSVEDAQDLTQAFFARLLEHGTLASADREKGRFRTFLLTALDRFMKNEWEKTRALKRGGGMAPISLDAGQAEERYGTEPACVVPAEILFDRGWALALLERAMDRLEADYAKTGRAGLFVQLKDFLVAQGDEGTYSAVAAAAGLSEGAARVAVHRLRRRFREVFREELAETVAPEELEDELRHLRAVLSAGV